MDIIDLAQQPAPVREQAAALLVDGFHEPRGWPNVAAARDEFALVLATGIARAAHLAGNDCAARQPARSAYLRADHDLGSVSRLRLSEIRRGERRRGRRD